MVWNRWPRIAAGAAAVALVAVTACDEDTEGPPVEMAGLEFAFAGSDTGTYQSDGRVPGIAPNGRPDVGSWAVARPDSLGGLVIAGYDDEETSLSPMGFGDVFILQLAEIREGVFEPCDIFASGGCHGRFFVGVVIAELATVQDAYEITDGRVEISEASATRVRGTFDATFTSADGTKTLTVTDGFIDVPFSNDPGVANGLGCLARNLRDGTNEPC